MASPTMPAVGPGRDAGLVDHVRRCAIKLVIFDVDGVFTDGRLYVGAQGETFKAFHVLDGQGIKQVMDAGIVCAVISGRDGAALRLRMSELGIEHVAAGVHDKLSVAQALLDRLGLVWGQVAVMGDDWPDLPLLTRAGFACAPPNAHHEIIKRVHLVTRLAAGKGAVRECCDVLLAASGHDAVLLARLSLNPGAPHGP
jgi:3-deoxy-D-manno-octulosonate 8-phosphate phosphatase (KDO 8-P phosphatase)